MKLIKKMATQLGEVLIGIPRMMVGLSMTQRELGKVTLLYSGVCSIDDAVERASHLKSARDEIEKKYIGEVKCSVGSGSYGFDSRDLNIPADGIFELGRYYVVNLEEQEESDDFSTLRDATLDFVSLVPEKVVISLYSHKDLERAVKDSLLETGKYLNRRR